MDNQCFSMYVYFHKLADTQNIHYYCGNVYMLRNIWFDSQSVLNPVAQMQSIYALLGNVYVPSIISLLITSKVICVPQPQSTHLSPLAYNPPSFF
jgi:hypothetical protein